MSDKTTSSIMISVPRRDVMAVIADFGAYPEWLTAMQSAEVIERGDNGRATRVRFRLDAGVIKDSFVLGYRWDDDAEVWWDLTEPGSVVSEMAGGYRLADRGDQTEVSYELTVGLRMPLPGLLKRRAEKLIIDSALNGLRSRAEDMGGSW